MSSKSLNNRIIKALKNGEKLVRDKMPLNYATYGPVQIMCGRYQNRIGYYDDDEGDKAIVYIKGMLGGPKSKYVLVPADYLIEAETYFTGGFGRKYDFDAWRR